MKHYAKLWKWGRGATDADTGNNAVFVYSFKTKASRDRACAEYSAPNHCPTAALESAPASDVDVRRQKRGDGGIFEWPNQ